MLRLSWKVSSYIRTTGEPSARQVIDPMIASASPCRGLPLSSPRLPGWAGPDGAASSARRIQIEWPAMVVMAVPFTSWSEVMLLSKPSNAFFGSTQCHVCRTACAQSIVPFVEIVRLSLVAVRLPMLGSPPENAW